MSKDLSARISARVRIVEGFPVEGVRFLDIGPVIADPVLFGDVVAAMAAHFLRSGITHVLGLEARGLYFAGAVAISLGTGLVPVRKPGKLPPDTMSATGSIGDFDQVGGVAKLDPERPSTYRKPYEFEIATGSIPAGSRVLIVDDLLAKGGSSDACVKLVQRCNAELAGATFLIELNGLGGRARLSDVEVRSLLAT